MLHIKPSILIANTNSDIQLHLNIIHMKLLVLKNFCNLVKALISLMYLDNCISHSSIDTGINFNISL